MGSATPSYEMLQLSNDNTIERVNLFERFEQQQFAELMMLNLSELKKQNRMQGFFSDHAIEEIKLKVKNRDKIIVYHNRKGYAPFIQCSLCGHTTQCVQCDIALTFYKSSNQQRCNYCGYQQNIPKSCLACGGNELLLKGVGTEKIVEELNILFPELRIARFDQQSIKKRSDFQKILNAFDSGEIDILVGTQLLAKGIDFEDVALIVVPDADVMLNIPDFRSHERAFQQLYQLSGRAGRGKKRGLVMVQSYQPSHLVLEAVKTESYLELAESELAERKTFGYPPFTRLVEISLKHKDQQTVFSAAAYFNNIIRTRLSDRLLGPLTPSVAKVKNMYIQHFLLKMDRQKDNIPKIKEYLLWAQNQLQTAEGFSGVRIDFDVDPN
jgi:primosomal protein N' (replication factor Y)